MRAVTFIIGTWATQILASDSGVVFLVAQWKWYLMAGTFLAIDFMEVYTLWIKRWDR